MPGKTVFVCQECGSSSPKWTGKCPGCGAWSSMVEESNQPASRTQSNAPPARPQALNEISQAQEQPRISSGFGEVDQVLGGGIVAGGLMLLAGEPGIGKSTLLLQMAAKVAEGHTVLYVSGEESLRQIKLRADRLGIGDNSLQLLAATDVDAIIATIADMAPDFVVVDSVQTISTSRITSSPGTVSQITTTAHMLQEIAKQSNTTVLVAGHVTKEGNIAGPKILEHVVDVVLHLEGERFGGLKLLRGVKNRFGSTHEVGVFQMRERGMVPISNPSASFLQERQAGSGSVVFAAMEGSRPLLVEVQALVNNSPFGYPKRTGAGFDANRLNVLIAVLGQRAGVQLGDKDVYVNIVGGMKIAEPAADLAVALAIASAARQQPVPADAVVFGEVGLSGEIRSVPNAQSRIKEAKKLKFAQAFAPAGSGKHSFITPVETMKAAASQGLSKEA